MRYLSVLETFTLAKFLKCCNCKLYVCLINLDHSCNTHCTPPPSKKTCFFLFTVVKPHRILFIAEFSNSLELLDLRLPIAIFVKYRLI